MDNKIDLDEITMLNSPRLRQFTGVVRDELRVCMKEAIRQALVLASEIDPIYDEEGEVSQDKQSILAINNLVV